MEVLAKMEEWSLSVEWLGEILQGQDPDLSVTVEGHHVKRIVKRGDYIDLELDHERG